MAPRQSHFLFIVLVSGVSVLMTTNNIMKTFISYIYAHQ